MPQASCRRGRQTLRPWCISTSASGCFRSLADRVHSLPLVYHTNRNKHHFQDELRGIECTDRCSDGCPYSIHHSVHRCKAEGMRSLPLLNLFFYFFYYYSLFLNLHSCISFGILPHHQNCTSLIRPLPRSSSSSLLLNSIFASFILLS